MQFRVSAGGGRRHQLRPGGGRRSALSHGPAGRPGGGHSGPGRGGREDAPDDAQRGARAAHRRSDGIDFEGGPEEVLVNNTPGRAGTRTAVRPDFTAITVGGITTGYSELPNEGETEVWEIINTTADAHPIHLHLDPVPAHQPPELRRPERTWRPMLRPSRRHVLAGRLRPAQRLQRPNADGAVGGNPAVGPFLRGPARPPEANEAGWKDTVVMRPGQVTRIVVRWAPIDLPVSTPAADLHLSLRPERRATATSGTATSSTTRTTR